VVLWLAEVLLLLLLRVWVLLLLLLLLHVAMVRVWVWLRVRVWVVQQWYPLVTQKFQSQLEMSVHLPPPTELPTRLLALAPFSTLVQTQPFRL
jgi:hypothetical protein